MKQYTSRIFTSLKRNKENLRKFTKKSHVKFILSREKFNTLYQNKLCSKFINM